MYSHRLNLTIPSLLIFVVTIFLSWTGYGLCQSLAINEFMASNASTAADQDGEYDDWIELYNFGASALSLAGYTLTDSRDNLPKWTFPDTSIQTGAYLIVWADNDDGQAGIHASFKLSASGEDLILCDASGAIVDSLSFGTQNTDISYGRFPNGTGAFHAMPPTFAAPNSSEYPPGDDLTEFLFDADYIHKFELQFFTENWQDSLEYNFEELGEAFMPARLIYNDSTILDSIGVRYKGNSSYIRSGATVKKPFKFKFDEYIPGQTLLGAERLNFSNSVSDPTFMREMIGYYISRKLMPSPRAVYANIYVGDEFIGLYVQVEQVDELFLNRFFEDTGGNLYKASDDGATLKYLWDEQSAYETEYELKTNEDENDWSNFIDMLEKLNTSSNESFVQEMSKCLNLDGVISHLAFNMVLSSFDSYTGSGRNFYFYDDLESDLFHLIPWDLNETFGTYSNNWNVITQDVLRVSNAEDRPLMRRMAQNDSLRAIYFDRIREMINGYASPDTVAMLIERYQPLIEAAVLADDNKLYTTEQFYTNIDDDVRISLGQVIPGLKSFSERRSANILEQITDLEVYPGDCDNNGVVDALDILPIGVHFQSKGSPRTYQSLSWQPTAMTQWYDKAGTYADANGNGVVDERDVIAIGVNWGNTASPSGISYAVDPEYTDLISQHKDSFVLLYNSLSGNGATTLALKSLLETMLDAEEIIPSDFELGQNFPNPFNPTTTISFSLPEDQTVSLVVYDLCGNLVLEPLINQHFRAGKHEIFLDASSLPNGLYLYSLQTGNWRQVRKMAVIK